MVHNPVQALECTNALHRVCGVSGVSIPESERAVRRGGFLTLVYRKSVRENVVVSATRLGRVFVVVIVVVVVAVFADFGLDCILRMLRSFSSKSNNSLGKHETQERSRSLCC